MCPGNGILVGQHCGFTGKLNPELNEMYEKAGHVACNEEALGSEHSQEDWRFQPMIKIECGRIQSTKRDQLLLKLELALLLFLNNPAIIIPW